jgi:hypothetical protein
MKRLTVGGQYRYKHYNVRLVQVEGCEYSGLMIDVSSKTAIMVHLVDEQGNRASHYFYLFAADLEGV